jgi:spore germination cell wall hydrolase CwlJ-like protein
MDLNDIQSLALVAWKEARGEGITGCIYVMHVVCNRVGFPGFATTLHNVIYGKNQFTSMSVPMDPEFNLQPGPTDPTWLDCLSIAPEISDNWADDPTHGAHYYANERNIQTNGWYARNIIGSAAHPITVIYGNHTFRI